MLRPRPPVGPPELPGPEDLIARVPADDCPKGHGLWLVEAPSDVQRLEMRLEEWMQRLEFRLDGLDKRWRNLPGWAHYHYADDHHQAFGPSPKVLSPRGSPSPRGRSKSPERGSPRGPRKWANQHVAASNGSLGDNGMHPSHSCGTKSDQAMVRERSAQQDGPRNSDMSVENSWRRKWRRHYSTRSSVQGESILEKVVMHEYFDVFIALIVVFNAVVLGVQVNHDAIGGTKNDFFEYAEYAEYACSAVFTMELVMRVGAFGCRRLCGEGERLMSCVDVLLVVVSWCDIIISLTSRSVEAFGSSAFIGKLVKIVRIGRIMRVLRTVRLLGELRVMAAMIFNSFRSLFWLFCILLTLSYVFALILTQGATAYLQEGPGAVPRHEELVVAFGSLFSSMFTLFKSMTGGRNWGEVADLATTFGWQFSLLVVVYIFLTLFSVLNIVTGVFVDGAIELAKRDRSMMVEKQAKVREASAHHLLSLLQEMDTSGDGVITLEEFDASLNRDEIREFMAALGIDIPEATNVFLLLDRNEDGTVDVKEFVEGMQKLRGDAKSSDIHMLLLMSERILSSIQKVLKGRPVLGRTMSMLSHSSNRTHSKEARIGQLLGFTESSSI